LFLKVAYTKVTVFQRKKMKLSRYILSFVTLTGIAQAVNYPALLWSNAFAGANYPMMPTQVNLSTNKTFVYVSGYHAGPLFGMNCPILPVLCCYLIKFNAATGKFLWLNYWGNGNYGEWAGGQTVDPTTDIPSVGGYTNDNLDGQFNLQQNLLSNDLYLIGFDKESGNRSALLFGTPGDDVSNDMRVDKWSYIYYCGWTTGNFLGQQNLGGFDNFLLKFDGNYKFIWARQWGTPTDDFALYLELSNDHQHIWVAGVWNSGFHAHPYDLWRPVLPGVGTKTSGKTMAKYNQNGVQLWTEIWGKNNGTLSLGWLGPDRNTGNLYLSMTTDTGFEGCPNYGFDDIYIVRYRPNAIAHDPCWLTYGTPLNELSQQTDVDLLSNVFYILGHTYTYGQYSFFSIKTAVMVRYDIATGTPIPIIKSTQLVNGQYPAGYAFPLIDSNSRLLYLVGYFQLTGSFLASYNLGPPNKLVQSSSAPVSTKYAASVTKKQPTASILQYQGSVTSSGVAAIGGIVGVCFLVAIGVGVWMFLRKSNRNAPIKNRAEVELGYEIPAGKKGAKGGDETQGQTQFDAAGATQFNGGATQFDADGNATMTDMATRLG
jgi:hypothetical protein